jgi:hypothetical protein
VFFKSTDVIARKVIYEGLQKLNSWFWWQRCKIFSRIIP